MSFEIKFTFTNNTKESIVIIPGETITFGKSTLNLTELNIDPVKEEEKVEELSPEPEPTPRSSVFRAALKSAKVRTRRLLRSGSTYLAALRLGRTVRPS